MNLLHKQIGLDFFIESSSFVSTPIDQIAQEVRDYGYNGPFKISGPHLNQPRTSDNNLPSYDEYVSFLETLAEHEIICYKITQLPINDPETNSSFTLINAKVFITNRYKFDQLHLELMWSRSDSSYNSTIPSLPENLLYYDRNSGEMYFNGLHKFLKGRNKRLLDALFVASPNHVPRDELIAIAHSEEKYADQPSKSAVSALFTNLRKVCGVSGQNIIQLRFDGKLNVHTYPLTAQVCPHDL